MTSWENPSPSRISRARASSAYPPSSSKRACTSPNRARIWSISSARAGSASASSSVFSSAATSDTAPAPAITSATTGRPFISPTSWLKYPMLMFFSTETCPSSGDSSRMIIRKMVDLPAPLGPTRPIFSPRNSAAEASTKRICGPCCLLI